MEQIALQVALPPVCAGGLFHYTLLISLAVLQTALNVSSCGHRDSVSIIGIEAATVNQELIASVHVGKGRRASSVQRQSRGQWKDTARRAETDRQQASGGHSGRDIRDLQS